MDARRVGEIALGVAAGAACAYALLRLHPLCCKSAQVASPSKALTVAEQLYSVGSVKEMEELAYACMPAYRCKYYTYMAGDRLTQEDIHATFRSLQIVPRVMRNVESVSTSITVFGQTMPSPIIIGPTGFLKLVHEDGEVAVAKAAASRHVGYVYNYVYSTCGIEEIAQARGDGAQWVSMYILKERDYVLFALRRIEELGFTAITLTLDHPHDRVKNLTMPMFETSGDMERLGPLMTSPNHANFMRSAGKEPISFFGSNDSSLTWDDVKWFISQTRLPVICKGILTPDDARMAVSVGAKGILVSNHGCRQMDSQPAAIKVLPSIVAAVGGQVPVFIDSGFRSGAHVFKALALGATAVLLGRAPLWGLAVAGEQGVAKVLDIMQQELQYDMRSTGCRTISDIDKSVLYSP